MLTQIDVMSETAIELPILGVTPKSSFLLQKVTGLNPPDRDLFIGDYSQDGGIYQGRRVGVRNVVFTIGLNPNPALGETVSNLRKKLYKAFIDPQVEGDYLKFVLTDDDDNETYFVGYCEKFDTEIFSNDTLCQISMMCPDPYIRDNTDTVLTSGSGWVQVPFTYQGTANTGFVVRIYVTTPTTEITLENNGRVMQLVNPDGYEAGDIIIINTIPGQRSITLTKDADLTTTGTVLEFTPPTGYITGDDVFSSYGVWKANSDDLSSGTTYRDAPEVGSSYWDLVSTPIVSHLLASSRWLELHSVANTMRVYEGTSPDSAIGNIKYLKYTSAYWGI